MAASGSHPLVCTAAPLSDTLARMLSFSVRIGRISLGMSLDCSRFVLKLQRQAASPRASPASFRHRGNKLRVPSFLPQGPHISPPSCLCFISPARLCHPRAPASGLRFISPRCRQSHAVETVHTHISPLSHTQ